MKTRDEGCPRKHKPGREKRGGMLGGKIENSGPAKTQARVGTQAPCYPCPEGGADPRRTQVASGFVTALLKAP